MQRTLIASAMLLIAGCQPAAPAAATPGATAATVRHLVYAAQDDGTIHVYDMDQAHYLMRTIPVFACCADVRGATAAAPTHGIAFTPDERQVWVNDGGISPWVHVFDMTVTPPRQVQLVRVSNGGPHWVTFSIDGRFAYVAGRKGAHDPTDAIDPRTYQRVAELGPSEDLLEVEVVGTTVTAVGNQFGVGRVTH
jgi:DNA-binding beta-propeller fold protein YncE